MHQRKQHVSTKQQGLGLISGLLVLCTASAAADFSRSQAILHPRYPAAEPFIIEISGTWPTDCHPGEQKPRVEFWDGNTVRIAFDIIVVHITCNDRDTPYRSLVDMSEALRGTAAKGDTLAVQVDFEGAPLEATVDLVCPPGDDCGGVEQDRAAVEPGLYYASEYLNQGLLLARQGAATAIYPLVYDKDGNSTWLFTGNLMTEDAFFAEVLAFSGGDCFGCEPGGATPDMSSIGYLSVLADQPGVLQVKVNDGLFTPYRSLVFGYRSFAVGPAGEQTLIDLAGRWGLGENHGTDPPLGDLTAFLPAVFDLELEDIVTASPGLQQDGQVSYLATGPTGEPIGQVLCKGQTAGDGVTGQCEFIDPTDAAEPLFLFYQLAPSRLAIEYARPVIAIGRAPGGQAVRLE